MCTLRISEKSVRALRDACEDYGVSVFGSSTFELIADPTCLRLLGDGTYGTCYLVVVSNSQWVIKSVIDKTSCVQSLVTEIQALSALQGVPDLQKVIGICPWRLALITEYAGETLARYLETHKCTLSQRLQIVRQVSHILLAVKERGWVHTDVKSDNICIQSTAIGIRTTLIDFGLATKIGGFISFTPGTVAPSYMAPEVVKNRPLTSQADVYSVGRLLQFLVKGNVHHLTRDVQRWMSHATNPDPNQRYSLEVLSRLLH
ncbi:probable CTD kinase subunit alpha homolog [Homarus americanus]|uniref:probable CTD kinase subunit alpha homolog n=1 Tax=Homarus americanus TaxID=6706 RepID=UPI001C493EB0|nr:probable CTD kinase subunit alpha homolog [Homarus americanus]